MGAQTSKDRILNEIRKRLCSQNAHIRERQWRILVRDLRAQGRDPSAVSDALTEFLSITVEAIAPGMKALSPADYHKLFGAEKAEVDKLYQECLKTAVQDFLYIFQLDVINVPTSPADVLLAERAASQLPRLNADQRSLAKALGIPEQDYGRGVLAKQYSEDRYRFYAEVCWRFLVEAAKSHSAEVVGVIYDVSSSRFYCDVRSDSAVRRFVLNARMIWEPLEGGDKFGLDKAREAVRFAVEQVLAPTLESASSEVNRWRPRLSFRGTG